MQEHFKLLNLFLFFILLSSFVLAVPPVTTTQSFSEGYIIKAPIQEYHKQNTDYTFNFHVFNISNGVPIINSINMACYFHLYNASGNHIVDINPVTTFDHQFDYEVNVKGTNFTAINEYHYIFQCNSTFGRGGYTEDYFFVTSAGTSDIISTTTSKLTITSLIIALVLCLTLFIVAIGIKEYAVGALSGIGMIAIGVYTAINGVSGFSNDLTTGVIALILIGLGAYIFIKGGIESVE